jgi:hypothetical protein
MVKVLIADRQQISYMNLEESGKVGRRIRRMFKLEDINFQTFPPGYFERLFAEIVSLYKEEIDVEAFEDALIIRKGEAMEVIVLVEGDEFSVTVSTLNKDTKKASTSSVPNAEVMLTDIRSKVQTNVGPVIREYCVHPINLKYRPLDEAEQPKETDDFYQKMYYGLTYRSVIESKLEKIAIAADENKDVLRRAIVEAKEIHYPYCFVLLDAKLGSSSDGLASESKSVFQYLMSALSNTVRPTNHPRDTVHGQPIQKALGDEQTLWFYLLDQYTMEPIVLAADDPNSLRYPIQISRPSEFIQSWLPTMATSLSVMKGVNGVTGVARLLGYPVPDLTNFLESADSYLKKIEDKARVNANMVIGSKEENASKTFFRGFKLQDLEEFYRNNNCEDIVRICNIYMVMDKGGYLCWTVGVENKDKLFNGIPYAHHEIREEKSELDMMLKGEVARIDGNDDPLPFPLSSSTSSPAVKGAHRPSRGEVLPKFECYFWKHVSQT